MREFKKALFFILGLVFIVFGIIGLALPFLQGFLFLAVGIALLAFSSPKFRAWLESHTHRYPRIHRAIQKLIKWLEKNIGN